MGVRLQIRLLDPFLASLAILPLALALAGCGAEEELKPDVGVSPFYTGEPGDSEKTAAVRPVTNLADRAGPSARTPGSAGSAGAAGSPAEGGARPQADVAQPFSFDELDKLNKAAIKLAEKGAFAESARAFDEVLGAEPENRQALAGRASVSTQLMLGLSEQDRATEIGRAADLMRTLKRTYKPLLSKEIEIYGMTLFNEAAVLGVGGRADTALEVLQEALDGGFDKWAMLEASPAFKSVRDDPRYRGLVSRMKTKALETARERVKTKLDQNVDFSFRFQLKDPDGKVVSSDDLKGKVVLVDVWGTWCGPCLSALPGLVELHRKYADLGLAVVGINYEKAPPEAVGPLVKQFVEANQIPYPCVLGDEATQNQIHDFAGFPTTLILDGAGKVRLMSVGAQPGEAESIEDAVMVLLDDLAKTKKP